MIYCYPDCETSGLWRSDLAADDPSQPHMLSIAALLTDHTRTVLGQWYAIVRPEGWSIEPGAEAVHGISERTAYRVGIPAWLALAGLQAMVENANYIVGHNVIMFDRQVIALELARAKQAGTWWHRRANEFIDTMEMATPMMKLEGKMFGEFKSPSLQEAVRHFGKGRDSFDDGPHAHLERIVEKGALEDWVQTHKAFDDVRAAEFVHSRMRTDASAKA